MVNNLPVPQQQWQGVSQGSPPPDWGRQVAAAVGQSSGQVLGPLTLQLLWQRGLRDPQQVVAFLDCDRYQPSPPSALPDMALAVERLVQARDRGEKVAIWGDFDADGLTATAVLWEGLGQFFPQHSHLTYYIPHRIKESHGLSQRGLDQLGQWGAQVLVTCDTGSTAEAELAYAQECWAMAAIVTDHHTLPPSRPPVVALVNPRYLPPEHPLADLSGVAVAYKLVEALYDRLPTLPQRPLEELLDLVAIGLIADLVALRGDCRYLAQRGLRVLRQRSKDQKRPGVAELLALSKRAGDHPTDISYGIAPRINAISRIYGDAHFGVELLTNREVKTAKLQARKANAANDRRRTLQDTLLEEAQAQVQNLDLATTYFVVLSAPHWHPGLLGLVAGQLTQELGRPVLLLQADLTENAGESDPPILARGSARSIPGIDLYTLIQDHRSLLTSFGGHPLAAGLSLPVENIPLLTVGLNRALRTHIASQGMNLGPTLAIDGVVTVAELNRNNGHDLFQQIQPLEPYGMGNLVPRFLVRGVQLVNGEDDELEDSYGATGRKPKYPRVRFQILDPTIGEQFPGIWWGYRNKDLPQELCDLVIEVTINTHSQRYEARLIAVRPAQGEAALGVAPEPWVRDWRQGGAGEPPPPVVATCPEDWGDLLAVPAPPLTLAYGLPAGPDPLTQWRDWVGIGKYLARTGEQVAWQRLLDRFGWGPMLGAIALETWQTLGFQVSRQGGAQGQDWVQVTGQATGGAGYGRRGDPLLQALEEVQFRRQYFYQVPAPVVQQVIEQMEQPAIGQPVLDRAVIDKP